jgi:molecular chaperone DnaK (HSP70)
MNETRGFSPEQITAMFLTKLKAIAETNTSTKVIDCVISVPPFMTDSERRAILDSAQIAGLNCLKLMNESTAVALCYGIYHSSLPEIAEPSHKVIFVDMGYTQLQASVVAFNKGKLRVLATVFDNNLGGRDFDKVLMDHFQQEFKAKYKIDAYSNTRARIRLRTECEKMKKLMSSNSSPIPLNIECFMNDIDVSSKLKREDFEKLAESLLDRVRRTLSELLVEAKLKADEIDLVEIVGGSTRIPAVKQIIQDVYNKAPATTLNQDEACARGCTLMCAILSPTFRVKDFKIEDSQLFPIVLTWKGAETDDNELEVFPQYDKIPMSKLLTIYKKEPFEIEARYRYPNNIPINDSRIGKFQINNVTPNSKGENSEVKLKARVTKSGIFEISTPQVIETIETDGSQVDQADNTTTTTTTPSNTADEQQQNEKTNDDNGDDQKGESQDGQTDETTGQEQVNSPQSKVSKKKKTKATDLPLTAKVPQLNKQELNYFIEQELSMIAQDRKEKERSEAKNSVEEYIYESRDKVTSEHSKFLAEDVTIIINKQIKNDFILIQFNLKDKG